MKELVQVLWDVLSKWGPWLLVVLRVVPAEKVQAFLKRHPIELMGGYIESFEWLKLDGFRPFTLVIDRQGILRKHFFGVSDYEGFEPHIRPYL